MTENTWERSQEARNVLNDAGYHHISQLCLHNYNYFMLMLYPQLHQNLIFPACLHLFCLQDMDSKGANFTVQSSQNMLGYCNY